MALCLYARPDFALFLLPVVLYLYLTRRSALSRIFVVAGSCYAPWLVFTTLYYGSPVPNTIVAKSLGYSLWTSRTVLFSREFWTNTWDRIYDSIFLGLGPAFAGHGTGYLKFMDEGMISRLCVVLILLGIIAMAFRFQKFYIIPLGSLAVYSIYYVYFVPAVFGWYLVPFSAINCLSLVLALGALFDALVLPGRIALLSQIACVAYLLPFLAIVPVTFKAEKDIQQYVENPVRRSLGEYLFAHKKAGETVASESLGYVGYYSRMPVYDYPGLASSEVTRYLKEHPDGRMLDPMLKFFKPDWIVLRPHELNAFAHKADMHFLETEYQIQRKFQVDPVLTQTLFRSGSNIDRTFYLLKKGRTYDDIPFTRVGPVLTDVPAPTQSTWKIDGHDPAVGRPPVEGALYGSWIGNDANVGRLHFGPFHVKQQNAIAIPVAAGPETSNLSVKVLNSKTGQVIASLNPMPPVDHWWAWNVALPNEADPVIEIIAEDAGTHWGQWLAIGAPHSVYDGFPRLGAMLTGDSLAIKGAWKIDGQDSATGRPPFDGPVYGSWIGNDGNVGSLRLGPFHIKQQTAIAIPLVTGPL